MEIALPWVWNPSSWGGTQNFLFLLLKKKYLLAPSIPVDALFQCTCPLLVANFQGPSVWNHPIDVDILKIIFFVFVQEGNETAFYQRLLDICTLIF